MQVYSKYQYYANPDIKDYIVLYLVPVIVYDMFLYNWLYGVVLAVLRFLIISLTSSFFTFTDTNIRSVNYYNYRNTYALNKIRI